MKLSIKHQCADFYQKNLLHFRQGLLFLPRIIAIIPILVVMIWGIFQALQPISSRQFQEMAQYAHQSLYPQTQQMAQYYLHTDTVNQYQYLRFLRTLYLEKRQVHVLQDEQQDKKNIAHKSSAVSTSF